MAKSWNNHVNVNFFGADFSYIENTNDIEFLSGRKISYLKNSTPKKIISLILSVDDRFEIEGKTEFEWFLSWYENEILSGTEAFELTDLISHTGTKNYMLESIPTWSGQAIKQINLEVREI